MGYQIEAFLDEGKPTLKIVDVIDKSVCLQWSYQGESDEKSSHSEIQRLFRELLLLTCKQDVHNSRTFHLSSVK